MSAALLEALNDWARTALDGATFTGAVAAEGGASSETWLVDAQVDGRAMPWVLRIESRGHQVYQDASVERQYRVIEALAGRDLPVPAAIAFEGDAGIVGAPFFLMARAAGTAPPNDYHRTGLLAAATPAAREAMWAGGVALLARLHRVDPAPFAFLAAPGQAPGTDAVVQELARWDAYRHWSGVPHLPLYDDVRRWLDDHRPAAPAGFAWGDARLPNMLFDAGRCTALLDWETASLGGAESDLGWWIFYDRMIAEAEGMSRLDGIGDAARTLALWEREAGRKAHAIEWHLVFAGYRFALISERARMLAIAAGRVPADAWGEANPAVRLLGAILPG